jgi:hypothetical protein
MLQSELLVLINIIVALLARPPYIQGGLFFAPNLTKSSSLRKKEAKAGRRC